MSSFKVRKSQDLEAPHRPWPFRRPLKFTTSEAARM